MSGPGLKRTAISERWLRASRSRPIQAAEFLLLAALFLAVAWALVEPHLLAISRITVAKPDVSPDLNGFKIVQLSDIHYGPFMTRNYLGELVDKANALDPDLIVITGDYIYNGNQYIAPVFDELARLRSRYGIYSIMGNHDSRADLNAIQNQMRQVGIVDISGSGQWIRARGQSFYLAGMGSLWKTVYPAASAVQDNAKREDLVVFLFHNSDMFSKMLSNFPGGMIDLALGGHTHGGQVTFFGLYAPLLPIQGGQEYRSGIVDKKDGMTIIISRGIGEIGLPLRFFSKPEIVLITLQHQARQIERK